MEPEFRHLTPVERRDLLCLARDTIAAALHGGPPPQLETPTAALLEPRGVFVSLHVLAQLRGCVGTLAADRSLHDNVAHMALAAAFDDPRFPPLTPPELPDTEIEISRLTVPVPTRPDDVVVGRDGICVMHGDRRGLFLPQVAPLFGWDRERFLDEVCRKANLPPAAWREQKCRLLRFEAEVFGENSRKAKDEG